MTSAEPVTETKQASSIYVGTAVHRRHIDPKRIFSPKLYLPYLDLDHIDDTLQRIPVWSRNRFAPVQFRERDYLNATAGDLGNAARAEVSKQLGRQVAGHTYLLAHLRTFGWLFNPLTIYYFYQQDCIDLDAILLEVTNTPWHDRQWYAIDARNVNTVPTQKNMYVSPFLPMDLQYSFEWNKPGNSLSFRVNVSKAQQHIFDASLSLRKIELNSRTAFGMLMRYPALTHRVTLGIYRDALKMLAHRATLYRHPKHSAKDTDNL